MRATFTTSFIYDGLDGYRDRFKKLAEVLEVKHEHRGGGCVGQLSGITCGLDLGEHDVRRYIDEIVSNLHKISYVSFKIVWLLEGGDIIIREILEKPQQTKQEEGK